MPVTGSLHEKLTVTSGEKVDVNILTIREIVPWISTIFAG